jgi:GntR family transcriptional regulator/MocR family aminotransferase
VIEDDYDAEFRYDRAAVGAVQGLDPDRVAHVGTTAKTLAPGLRLGWITAPAWLAERLPTAKTAADSGSPSSASSPWLT